MATFSTDLPHAERFTTWFPDFLRKELAPYPGRGATVARMVIAATITTVLIVTFRIPGGAIGVLCAFLLSHESLLSTSKSALYLTVAFAMGGLFIPVGARLFASIPITHFLWEGISIFVLFFLLRILTNYAVALGLCAMTTNIFSIWYLTGPAAQNVELSRMILRQPVAYMLACLRSIPSVSAWRIRASSRSRMSSSAISVRALQWT
jgi:multidrug resistance protein MdtO